MITEVLLIVAVVVVVLGSGIFIKLMRDGGTKTVSIPQPEVRQDIVQLEKEVYAKADMVKKIASETRILQAPVVAPPESGASPNDTAMMRSVTEKVHQIKKCAGIE